MTVTLYHGDCLEVMRGMADSSVDAIIADPPYGISYQSARRTDKTKRLARIANDGQPFIWWLYDAYRVLKPGGALLCFCRWDTQEAFRLAIKWAGFRIRQQVIWDRDWHGMGSLVDSFAPQHDVIWQACKGRGVLKGKRPKSVLRHRRIAADKLVHPNEKPIPLLKELVRAVTDVGDVVLDPFMGSGSTGKAAVVLDRSFIGVELDEGYYAMARDGIDDMRVKPRQLEFVA